MSDPNLPGPESSQPTPSSPLQPAPTPPASDTPGNDSPVAPPAYASAPPAYLAASSTPPAAPYAGGPYAATQSPQAPMNTLAIIALVGGILFNVVGIVCGHIALSQIKRTGERGRGLALAGTIIGYVSLAFSVIALIALFVFAGMAVQAAETSASPLSDSERSPEFCAALTTALETESNPNEIEFSAAEVAAYEALAAADSPHQEVYQKFADFTKDPSILTSDADFASVLGDFSSVLFEDSFACA